MTPRNTIHLNFARNAGVTVEDKRANQMVHFVRRIWARFGVGLTLEHMPDLADEVAKQILPENILKQHPDGRVVLIAKLGRFGTYPMVYDPTTRMLATVLEWTMVRAWKAQLDRRNRVRLAAEQQPASTS